MDREIWVGPNRRALGFGMVAPAIVLALGAWLFSSAAETSWRILGIALCALAAMALLFLSRECFRPRIAYRPGFVEFYLRSGKPDAVPLKHVEAFFLGHGSAMLPAKLNATGESVTLVARLSRRAEEWSHVEVKPQLGRWCDGYVTIRGTWCEPLTARLVERLNRRLFELMRGEVSETEH